MAIVYKNGDFIVRGPPYTKKEEAEFYKRIGNIKSLTVVGQTPAERKARKQKEEQPPPQ